MRAYATLLIATGLPVAVSLVLTPLITASVTTLEYGSYVNYLTLMGVTNIFVGLASAGYISNAYIHPESADQIISSMIWFMILTAAPAAVIAAVLTYLSDLPTVAITTALVAAGFCGYVTTSFQSFAILRRQYGLLLMLAASQVLLQSSIVVGLMWTSRLSLGGLVLGSVAGSGLACACAFLLWRRLGIKLVKPNRKSLLGILVYAIPLVPHMLLSLVSGSFDRWYLVAADNKDDLAIYAVASSIAGLMMILLDMGNKVYSPSVFDRLKASERKVRPFLHGIGKFLTLSILASIFVAALGYWYVIRAFDPKYAAAAWLCVGLALASSGFAIYYSASPFLYYFNKTNQIFLSSLSGAVATILISVALFGPLQLYGLVLGRLAGVLVSGCVALGFAWLLLARNHADPDRGQQ